MNKNNDEKYALITYNTINIGDYIQSIAARRFLPRVDYYINRDELGNWKNAKKEKVKIITNGWYMDPPYAWPIRDKTLDPLYISMYIEQDIKEVRQKMLSNDSREHFKKFGIVGARDITTKDFFTSNGIDAYLSGCLTLTLQKEKNIEKGNYILLTDVSEEVYQHVLKKTNLKVVYLTNLIYPYVSQEQINEYAELYLFLYQSAHCVITERLHTALPCLALETPVLLLKKDKPAGGNKNRLNGLSELTHHYSEKEFIAHDVYDINQPPPNPNKYIKFRTDLIKTCSEFTGFNNDDGFSWLGIADRTVDDVLNRMQFINASLQNISNLELYRSLKIREKLMNSIDDYKIQKKNYENIIEKNNIELSGLLTVRGSTRRLFGNIKRLVFSLFK